MSYSQWRGCLFSKGTFSVRQDVHSKQKLLMAPLDPSMMEPRIWPDFEQGEKPEWYSSSPAPDCTKCTTWSHPEQEEKTMMTISERRKRSSEMISVFPRARKATRLTFPSNYKPTALQFLDQVPGCLRQSQKWKPGVGSRVSAAILLLLGDAEPVPEFCSSWCRACYIRKLRANTHWFWWTRLLWTLGKLCLLSGMSPVACAPHIHHRSGVIFVKVGALVIRITVDQNLFPDFQTRLLRTQTWRERRQPTFRTFGSWIDAVAVQFVSLRIKSTEWNRLLSRAFRKGFLTAADRQWCPLLLLEWWSVLNEHSDSIFHGLSYFSR